MRRLPVIFTNNALPCDKGRPEARTVCPAVDYGQFVYADSPH